MDEGEIRQQYRKAVESTIAPGTTWRHYKGGLYRVVALACSEEDPEEIRVIYESLEKGFVWSRTKDSWLSLTGSGQKRFVKLSASQALLRFLNRILVYQNFIKKRPQEV